MLVTRLTLVVAEDSGGEPGYDEDIIIIIMLAIIMLNRIDTAASCKPPDLESLISSLPLQSNGPPYLHGLLSSLQHFSSHSSLPARDGEQQLDITQMISAFRQLRPVRSDPETSETAVPNQDREEHEEPTQCKEVDTASVPLGSLEALLDKKIAELEERLKCYIDTKVAGIVNQIEMKLGQIDSVKRIEINEEDKMSNKDGSYVHTATHNGLHLEEQLD